MRNESDIGKYNEAGLPGITGGFLGANINGGTEFNAGAFYNTGATTHVRSGTNNYFNEIKFDAARANVTYGRSSTVMPSSADLSMGIYLGRLAEVYTA